jgi:hypothetical protein
MESRLEVSEPMMGGAPPASNKRRFMVVGSAVVLAVVGVVVLAAVLSSKGSSSASESQQIMGKGPSTTDVSMFGRSIGLSCTASLVGVELQYTCVAKDAASGTIQTAAGYSTSQGATENAVNSLMVSLTASSIVTPPEETKESEMLLTLTEADLTGEDEENPDLAEKSLLGSSCKGGSTVVYGRTINFNGCGYMKGLSLRYKATATDAATGIQGSASGLKSGKGAVEHAIEELFKQLVARGVVVPAGKESTLEVLPAEIASMPIETAVEAEVDMAEKSSSGNVNVCGRNVHYSAGAYYKFPLSIKFKCDAKDTASGISASVRGHGKGEAACKDAIERVMKAVAAKGLPMDPTKNCGSRKQVADGDFNAVGGTIAPVTAVSEDDEIPAEKGGSKSGDFTAYGRAFHYKVSAGLKGFKLRYKATVTDKASNTVGSASGLKSGKGAVEHATKACFEAMIKKGIITPPAQKTVSGDWAAPTIVDTVVADVEDGSESEEDWQIASTDDVDLLEQADVADDSEVAVDGAQEKMFSKSGSTVVYGITIKWTATGYLKGLSWRYKATATGLGGVSGHASGLKSGEGAVKHAIEECFKNMQAAGVIPK